MRGMDGSAGGRVALLAGDDAAAWEAALRAQGFDVTAVPDAPGLLAAAGGAAAVVVATELPHGQGFAACIALRREPGLRVPIVLAGATAESARRHARLPGRADAYLLAPVEGDALARAVAEAIRRGPAPPITGRRARVGRAIAALGLVVVVVSLAFALGDDLRVWVGGAQSGRGWWRVALAGLVVSDVGRRVARGLPPRPGFTGWIALALLAVSGLLSLGR
jgi:CheY-like chemotaxis protein